MAKRAPVVFSSKKSLQSDKPESQLRRQPRHAIDYAPHAEMARAYITAALL